jgi:hypothetical protein
VIGHPEGSSSYGNFAFSFYGIITQSDWTQIFKDYPEINLSEAQASQKTYAIAFEIIRDNPLTLIRGIIRGWMLACGTRENIGYLILFHADYLETVSFPQSKG